MRPTHRNVIRCGMAALIASVLAIGALGGCSSTASTDADDGKPTVLTTFTVTADMARNVAGDHLNVESITKAGTEIHDYEPTARPTRARSRPYPTVSPRS